MSAIVTLVCHCGTTFNLSEDEVGLRDEDRCPVCNPRTKKSWRKAFLRDVNGNKKERQQDYFVLDGDKLKVNERYL